VSRSGRAHPQLALNIQLRDEATLENFLCVPPQRPLLRSLQTQLEVDGEPIIYLYGPSDTGKSHLLQGACHASGPAGIYLPLSELTSYPPAEVLQDVESMGLVCLDDIDAVLGNEAWEQALFHFFNRARQTGCRLLVSGSGAPRVLAVDLPDLRSRLSWGVVFQLTRISDDTKQEILCFRAARRGMQMPPEVASYIVQRAPRGLGDLLELLAELDAASLAQKRALSKPFVKEQFDW
jgi:DnaA family protein